MDYLLGRTNNNSVDLNRNFPNLDRIMFSNEESHIDHNNHLLAQVDRLDQPVSKRHENLVSACHNTKIDFDAINASFHVKDMYDPTSNVMT